MEKSFILPIKTFSLNKKHCRDARHTTRDYKDWEATVCYELDKKERREALKELRETFEDSTDIYILEFTAYYPREILFTKKDKPSSKCHDITNWEKPLQDILFDTKFFARTAPYGCKNLNIDDKYVFDLISKKRASDKFEIHVNIKILKKSDIFPEFDQSKEQS